MKLYLQGIVVIIFFLGMVILLQNFKFCNIMDMDFCKALIENDTSILKKQVNIYLSRLDAKANRNENLEKIKKWIGAYECVDSVIIEKQVLASDPPIQRFIIVLKSPSGPSLMRSIGVRLFDTKFTSDLK